MQITSRFTIAIHTMICIAHFTSEPHQMKVTSNFIAKSTNSNPVIIRKILGQLKQADLVDVKAGVGGASITKPLEDITLFHIFCAIEAIPPDFFHFHQNPNCKCPIGNNIHSILDSHLYTIQSAMNQQMQSITLKVLMEDTKSFL